MMSTNPPETLPPRGFLGLTNAWIRKHIRTIELIGVLMRITSFSLVSWYAAESPFKFVWIFNTIDALMLSYCSALKKDLAYTVLNVFWVIIGWIGIARAYGLMQ